LFGAAIAGIGSSLDPAEQVARYGADQPVHDWVRRLVCSRCGSRHVDFVLTGA
jgi:hypothetical protein